MAMPRISTRIKAEMSNTGPERLRRVDLRRVPDRDEPELLRRRLELRFRVEDVLLVLRRLVIAQMFSSSPVLYHSRAKTGKHASARSRLAFGGGSWYNGATLGG
jgi:hypothetical protein